MTIKRYKVVANCYGMELEDHTCEVAVDEKGEFVKLSELRELLEKKKAYYQRQQWHVLVEEYNHLLAELEVKP